MKPPNAQSPFAQRRHYPGWRMSDPSLRGRYSPVVALTDSFANPFGSSCLRLFASCKKSAQVATSPCCQPDLPDVISANPSSDAWSLATAVPRSAYTCFFLRVIGLPHEMSGSASRHCPRTRLLAVALFGAADIPLCSGLRVCSSPRSFPPLHMFRRAAGTFTSGPNVLRCLCTHRIC